MGKVKPEKITGEGIQRILEFVPFFEDSGSAYGKGPTFEDTEDGSLRFLGTAFSEKALEFISACYAESFVQPFDWSGWHDQHAEEFDSDAFIRNANLATIIKILTAHIRADRFCEGHLLSVMKNGTILRILKRIAEIKSE